MVGLARRDRGRAGQHARQPVHLRRDRGCRPHVVTEQFGVVRRRVVSFLVVAVVDRVDCDRFARARDERAVVPVDVEGEHVVERGVRVVAVLLRGEHVAELGGRVLWNEVEFEHRRIERRKARQRRQFFIARAPEGSRVDPAARPFRARARSLVAGVRPLHPTRARFVARVCLHLARAHHDSGFEPDAGASAREGPRRTYVARLFHVGDRDAAADERFGQPRRRRAAAEVGDRDAARNAVRRDRERQPAHRQRNREQLPCASLLVVCPHSTPLFTLARRRSRLGSAPKLATRPNYVRRTPRYIRC